MESERKIKAKRFLKDFREGMPFDALAEKYNVTPEELQNILGKLVTAGVLDEEELKVNLSQPTIHELIHELRNLRRCYTTFFVPVYDLDDLGTEGQLNDISEAGLNVSGIEATPGEEKTLLLRPGGVSGIKSLRVKAVCRWCKVQADGKTFCGFEVANWPPEAKEALPKLIGSLTMCDQP
jgi:hypothetical protein